MIRRHRIESVSLAFLAAGLLAAALPSRCPAAGHYNMPSTFRQCVGCGFGAGYHSQLTLEPTYKGVAASPGVRRTRPALNVASAMALSSGSGGFHQQEYSWCPSSASHNACEAPAWPAPAVQSEPNYAPAPIVAPGAALFAPPPMIIEQPADEGPDSPSDITPEESLPEPAPFD